MTAVQLMSQKPMRRASARTTAPIERETERSGTVQAESPAKVTAEFQPLDPGIVSETIPAFFIGRNMEGFWVARDANGRIGGIFLLERSALSFARENGLPAGCATIYPFERFELDLENSGNPLVAQLGWLRRLATRGRGQVAGLLGHFADAVKRRFRALHVL